MTSKSVVNAGDGAMTLGGKDALRPEPKSGGFGVSNHYKKGLKWLRN